MSQRYSSATAFRTALEQRLNKLAREQQLDMGRLRRHVAFERFLARIFIAEAPPWLLKGGYSLELRLQNIARATKDIDLTIPVPHLMINLSDDAMQELRTQLQEALVQDLGDWFVFSVGFPKFDIVAAPYGGARFAIEVRLAGRVFTHFQLDVGVGDAVVLPPEIVYGDDILDFAGIAPVRILALPRAHHFAEKIHAYSLPRGDEVNSRVKDLVDLVLLIQTGLPDSEQLALALHATFDRRKTHDIPTVLPTPPAIWQAPYSSLAATCGVSARTLDDAIEYVSSYWTSLYSAIFEWVDHSRAHAQ